MKNFDSVLTECAMAMLGVLFSQFCFLHGTLNANTGWLLAITVLMEIAISIYFVCMMLKIVWNIKHENIAHTHKQRRHKHA